MIYDKAFARLVDSLFAESRKSFPRRVAIALSGGVDSMGLSFLLARYVKFHSPNTSIYAITVDHKLRDESSSEARWISKYLQNNSERWGAKINHIAYPLRWQSHEHHKLHSRKNFENLARIKRYEAFSAVCHDLDITSLFVGHNLDDQIETYLMRRQFYNAGDNNNGHQLLKVIPLLHQDYVDNKVFGLTSIKSKSYLPLQGNNFIRMDGSVNFSNYDIGNKSFTNHDKMMSNHDNRVIIYRPLLDFHKQDIINTCQHHDIKWVQDKSNFDPSLTERNAIRHRLKGVLGQRSNDNHSKTTTTTTTTITTTTESLLGEINANLAKAQQYNRQIQQLKTYLVKRHWLTKCPEISSAAFKIPTKFILSLPSAVINRFFFDTLLTISASHKYYYKFLHMYSLSQSLKEFAVENVRSTANLTYLNMAFKLSKSKGSIKWNDNLKGKVIRELESDSSHGQHNLSEGKTGKIITNTHTSKTTDTNNSILEELLLSMQKSTLASLAKVGNEETETEVPEFIYFDIYRQRMSRDSARSNGEVIISVPFHSSPNQERNRSSVAAGQQDNTAKNTDARNNSGYCFSEWINYDQRFWFQIGVSKKYFASENGADNYNNNNNYSNNATISSWSQQKRRDARFKLRKYDAYKDKALFKKQLSSSSNTQHGGSDGKISEKLISSIVKVGNKYCLPVLEDLKKRKVLGMPPFFVVGDNGGIYGDRKRVNKEATKQSVIVNWGVPGELFPPS